MGPSVENGYPVRASMFGTVCASVFLLALLASGFDDLKKAYDEAVSKQEWRSVRGACFLTSTPWRTGFRPLLRQTRSRSIGVANALRG